MELDECRPSLTIPVLNLGFVIVGQSTVDGRAAENGGFIPTIDT